MSFGYILDAVRTPRGRGRAGKGALSGIHPQELFAQTLQQLILRNGIDAADVDDVIAGCVSHAGEQGANLARNAVLSAGWPLNVGATTLNRFCGSGAQAVNFAAMGVASMPRLMRAATSRAQRTADTASFPVAEGQPKKTSTPSPTTRAT